MTPADRLQAIRVMPPRCPQCPTDDNRRRCDACKAASQERRKAYTKAWSRRNYEKAKEQGICARCGDPSQGRWACGPCRGDDAERAREAWQARQQGEARP